METWFIILVSIFIATVLKAFINLFFPRSTHNRKLPPGPRIFPIIGNFLWHLKPFGELQLALRKLHAKFGPIVTIRIGYRHTVFINDRKLAYKALVQNGAVFSDRPSLLATSKILSSNQQIIGFASYGPTWRFFRRNLTTEILHPSRVRAYKHARKWVLQILLDSLKKESKSGRQPVFVSVHFPFSMFCLLVLMCFGDKLDQNQIREIEKVQRDIILAVGNFNILNFWPKLTKILLRKKWEQFLQLRRDQEKVFLPLILDRKKLKKSRSTNKDESDSVVSYIDILLDVTLPEEKRKLTDDEIVSHVSEFLTGGTDTTSTALEWIMANLVKYPEIQQKLYSEIRGVVKDGEEVNEEDLQAMPYLRAVVLEGLRRHPPGQVLLPHAVSEDVELEGYLIPKKWTVNVPVAEIGWDPAVWEDPMSFKPERFLNEEEFDLTGSKGIRMMPFGVGRRICPGIGIALLHLQYFVANLVWNFEWKAVDGDDVDLSEKHEFTSAMKNPLKALLYPRT